MINPKYMDVNGNVSMISSSIGNGIVGSRYINRVILGFRKIILFNTEL